MTLDEIALKYNTDKSSELHNYTEKYEKYFDALRNEKLKILEIGIQNGYSLKTWKEYFPNATIVGIDIAPCAEFAEDRIIPVRGSQSDTAFLKKLNDDHGPFDIIIDDGSHNSNDMKITMDFMFPLLSKGGLYVVEDIHCVYWPELADGGTAFMDRLKEMLDLVNSNGKCGLAEIKNIRKDHVYQNKKIGEMDWWEKSIEYIHLYRSIAFIKKYDGSEAYDAPPMKKHSALVLFKRFVGKARGRIIHTKNMLAQKILSFRDALSAKKKESATKGEIEEYRKKIKIYDIFTYNGEADILEIRLNILYPFVDRFIIVEAPTTFSGLKKPIYFEEQKARFSDFSDKIEHFVIDDYPNDEYICELADASSNVPKGGPEHWRREFYQKESIKKALVGINDDDICFIGDADEIWDPAAFFDYTKDDIFKLRQRVSTYYLNNISDEPWAGTMATKYKNIKNACLNHLRTKSKTRYSYVENGGWHFTNMGGVDEIRRKLNDSYTKESYNTDDVQKNLDARFGKSDYLGRKSKYRTDESGLPKYVLENKDKYNRLFK